MVPHLALGGELSKNQLQRAQLFSTNTVIAYVSGATFAFVAWSFFFAGESTRASDGELVPGHLDFAAYGPLVMTACALILVSIWFCAAGTYKHVPFLSAADSGEKRLTLLSILKRIVKTLKNRNYVTLLVGYFFFMIASGIYDTLNVFVNTYFWELRPDQIRWLGLIAAPSVVFGALLAPRLMNRFDRKPVMIAALCGTALFAQLVVDLRLLGLLPENHDPKLMYFLLANAAGFVFTLGIGTVAVMSMIGDVIRRKRIEHRKTARKVFFTPLVHFSRRHLIRSGTSLPASDWICS